MDPVHKLALHFPKIHSNIILQFTPWFSSKNSDPGWEETSTQFGGREISK